MPHLTASHSSLVSPVASVSEGDESWDLIIRPKRHLLDVNLKEIWEYRDLLSMFVMRDIVTVPNVNLKPLAGVSIDDRPRHTVIVDGLIDVGED